MTQPTAQIVMRNRAAVAEELRRLLPKMEGVRAAQPIPFGLAAIDRHLPQGGLACGALHEILPEAGATPAAFGFLVALLARISSPPPCGEGSGVGVGRFHVDVHALKLPRAPPPNPPPTSMHSGARKRGPGGGREKLFLVLPTYGLRDYGRPYGHGLRALGLDPRRLILAETTQRKDTLWAMEEALRSRAVAAVAGIIDQLDLKTSQRLHLAAADCGLPLFLLRPAPSLASLARGGGWEGGSAAATRWRVGPASAARDRFGLFTCARWRLSLERCRNGRTGEWMVEYDHVAHRFSLAAALADPAVSRRAGEEPFRRAG
jgi:protein ImuA